MTFVHKDPSRNSKVSEHFGMPCVYIAVLLIGPKNNQVFVDFPCGQPGDVRRSHLPGSGRPGKAFKSVNVKNAHGRETASRGDREG